MIRCENLGKSFASARAADGISLQVEKQSIVGLVGPDGAGKTTLMRMICGLITPDCGQVYLMGLSPDQIEKQHLGYMPQKFSLYGDLTVMENINFFASMYGLSKQVIQDRADEVLGVTNLADFKTRLADRLSGGMKQKLALTCALITRPHILVLDEPTYGVDPESRQEFWKILYRLNQEGMTILVSTPYMDEAELCHQVAFINHGKLAAFDSPANLKDKFPHQILEVRADIRDPYFFDNVSGVLGVSFFGYKYHLQVNDATCSKQYIENHLTGHGIKLTSIAQLSPSMEDLFVLMAEAGGSD